MTLSQL